MFFILNILCFSHDIVYLSSIQLQNVYTGNRLASSLISNIPNEDDPIIYSIQPPFDDTWNWIVEPSIDNIELSGQKIKCGSIITLKNAQNKLYISTNFSNNEAKVIPTLFNQGISSQWVVTCRNSNFWKLNEQINLMNMKYNCFLSTSFYKEIPDKIDFFEVSCHQLNSSSIWSINDAIIFGETLKNNEEINEEL